MVLVHRPLPILPLDGETDVTIRKRNPAAGLTEDRGVRLPFFGGRRRGNEVVPDSLAVGKPFAVGRGKPDDDAWKEAVAAEAKRLGGVLAAALEADTRTIGSPVYKEMPGLAPVDWSGVRTARSKYFGEVFGDWRSRVDVAPIAPDAHPARRTSSMPRFVATNAA